MIMRLQELRSPTLMQLLQYYYCTTTVVLQQLQRRLATLIVVESQQCRQQPRYRLDAHACILHALI